MFLSLDYHVILQLCVCVCVDVQGSEMYEMLNLFHRGLFVYLKQRHGPSLKGIKIKKKR